MKKLLSTGFMVALLAAMLSYDGNAAAQTTSTEPDEAITARVKTAILKSGPLGAMDIRVDTQGGVVRLTGFVNTTDDIAKAAEIARLVRGVSAVKNELRVANRPSRA